MLANSYMSDPITDRLPFAEWLAEKYLPIAGADGEGEGGEGEGGGAGTGTADAGGEGEGDAGSGAGASGEGNGNGGGGSGGDDDEDGDDVLELRRSDYERLRQIAREHETQVKKAATEEATRKRQQQIEQGKFEEMLREEAETRLATEAERDTARDELAAERRNRRVEGVAKRLGFKDPEDAMAFISNEDGDDDSATERALKKLARKKPYLVDTRRPTGVPIGGQNGALLTLEAIQNMSEDEVNANWSEVQKVLAANGS